jgi:uncharacterized membrane protein YfcA
MLIFIEKLSPSEAYPISTFLITICSSFTFYMGVMDKYQNPQNSFVEWDIAIIFCPTLLLGTKFGTILNKSLSSLFLTIFLALLVLLNIKKTYDNAQKARSKEILENLNKSENEKRYFLIKDDFQNSKKGDPVSFYY